MHPHVFLESHWRNDLRDSVFVAMDFRPDWLGRWTDVFQPAIESIQIGGRPLRAERVDTSKTGNSILTEIVDGVAHAQMVLADISVTARWAEGKRIRSSPNGNVMYEVGIAVACRQEGELLLVRDKNDPEPALFDVGHLPIIGFDPNDTVGSAQIIQAALLDRLRERQLVRDLRVDRLLRGLAAPHVALMLKHDGGAAIGEDLSGNPFSTTSALVQLGIWQFVGKTSEDKPRAAYVWTPIGKAVMERVKSQVVSFVEAVETSQVPANADSPPV